MQLSPGPPIATPLLSISTHHQLLFRMVYKLIIMEPEFEYRFVPRCGQCLDSPNCLNHSPPSGLGIPGQQGLRTSPRMQVSHTTRRIYISNGIPCYCCGAIKGRKGARDPSYDFRAFVQGVLGLVN